MSLLGDWLETFKQVLIRPTEFFESETRDDGFGYPLKFAVAALGLAAILNGVRTGVFGSVAGLMEPEIHLAEIAAATSFMTVYTFIAGLIGLFLGAAVVHLFVYILGGENSYRNTLAVFEYATALTVVTSLISLVPVIGALAGLFLFFYGIYIQTRGLEAFQGLSTERALASVLLPYAIVIALGLVAALIAGAAFLTMM